MFATGGLSSGASGLDCKRQHGDYVRMQQVRLSSCHPGRPGRPARLHGDNNNNKQPQYHLRITWGPPLRGQTHLAALKLMATTSDTSQVGL